MSCCADSKMKKCCAKLRPTGDEEVEKVHSQVQEFYSKAQQSSDLGSVAPCSAYCALDSGDMPPFVKDAIDLIHPDVLNSYFGCGLPYPHAVDGAEILDLGSGTGRDCFLLGYLVGPKGRVVGVDMTPAMLEKANAMIPYHAEKFGFRNVEFRSGTLEKLNEVEGLMPDSFDIAISNCVINLTKSKATVLKHVYSLLKPGGELCFSDVYCETVVPDAVANDERVWNECFGGALKWDDFVTMARDTGFLGPFVISTTDYHAVDPELINLTKDLTFWSKTVRLFKPMEGTRPDASAKPIKYSGTIRGCENRFLFSQDYVFQTNESKEVPDDLAQALLGSRFKEHFQLVAN